jgi:hypothetical protein
LKEKRTERDDEKRSQEKFYCKGWVKSGNKEDLLFITGKINALKSFIAGWRRKSTPVNFTTR